MRRLLPIAILVALVLPIAVAKGDHRDPKTFTIKTGDDFFEPTKKTIHTRDIVKWVWVGADKKPGETVNQHTIIDANQGKPYFKNSAPKTRGTFKVRFKKAGSYRILCAEHPEDMVLKLKVKS